MTDKQATAAAYKPLAQYTESDIATLTGVPLRLATAEALGWTFGTAMRSDAGLFTDVLNMLEDYPADPTAANAVLTWLQPQMRGAYGLQYRAGVDPDNDSKMMWAFDCNYLKPSLHAWGDTWQTAVCRAACVLALRQSAEMEA